MLLHARWGCLRQVVNLSLIILFYLLLFLLFLLIIISFLLFKTNLNLFLFYEPV